MGQTRALYKSNKLKLMRERPIDITLQFFQSGVKETRTENMTVAHCTLPWSHATNIK